MSYEFLFKYIVVGDSSNNEIIKKIYKPYTFYIRKKKSDFYLFFFFY